MEKIFLALVWIINHNCNRLRETEDALDQCRSSDGGQMAKTQGLWTQSGQISLRWIRGGEERIPGRKKVTKHLAGEKVIRRCPRVTAVWPHVTPGGINSVHIVLF